MRENLFVPAYYGRDPAPLDEILDVDLSLVSLFAFERDQDVEKILRYKKLACEGSIAPIVGVERIVDSTALRISLRTARKDGFPDGGHHRALAHLIAGKPLRVGVLCLPPAIVGDDPYTIGQLARSHGLLRV